MAIKSILSGAIVAGMLMTPLAAQAGTRASALARPATSQSAWSDQGPRKNMTVRRENGIAPLPLLLLVVAAIGGTVAVAKVIDDNKSRGAS
jgi:hypothetical protein